VYHAHFATSIYYDATESIWNSSASIKWKLAAWIFLQGRLWTADRLAKRGLPHHDKCVFCNFSSEDAHHFFLGCAVVKIIWSHMLTWAGFPQINIVAADQSLRCWWTEARRRLQNQRGKNLNSLIMLTLWSIRRERNGRVFDNIYRSLHQIIEQIKADAQQWSKASKGRLTLLVE
jgi:hypothetical protein